MKDRDLLVGIRLKEESCYEDLVDRYMRYVAAVVSKVAGSRLNSYDIEEITSDVFIKVWLTADRMNLKGDSMKAYLAISARNNTLNVLRQRVRRKEDDLDETISGSESAEDALMKKQEELEISSLISNLSETDQEIIVRRYFHMEKVKDIAKKLGSSEKAVSARIARSKEKLKSMLGQKKVKPQESITSGKYGERSFQSEEK